MIVPPPLQLAVLIGSTRNPRFGETVAGWFAGHARLGGDFDVSLVDLAEVDLPAVLTSVGGPGAHRLRDEIAAADAVVIVTPEYNHGYPASVKQALDLGGQEWTAKPVGFVSYGGMSGGIRAVEQLRQVVPELGGMTVRRTVALPRAWGLFSDDGTLRHPEHVVHVADEMLGELRWWGEALRTARNGDMEPAA